MPTRLLPSEANTIALGQSVADQARVGDTIAVSGPLGAGKTVLARGLIQKRVGTAVDVASPTFTLVQIYDQVTPAIWHFDLYRLEHPDECAELGLDEALATGISVIEWPDKAGGWLPEDHLEITLTEHEGTGGRMASLAAGPSWEDRLGALLEQGAAP